MAIKTPSKYKQMEYKNVILELVKILEPEVYVEFGIKKGHTFKAVAPHCRIAVAVDIIPANLNHKEIYKSAGFMSIPEDKMILEYWMTTEEFIKQWEFDHCKDIDFIFIDADHKCESIIADIGRVIPFLRPYHSVVCLHDTYPVNDALLTDGYCSDAWAAAKYIRNEAKDFEIVTLPGPWAGLSILRFAPSGNHGWMDINGEGSYEESIEESK